jgi:hypothetical protein
MGKFVKPTFTEGSVELRYEDNEVCIYGTEDGLKKLAELIYALIEKPKQGHIHLEDYELLTKESLIGAVAIFK